MVSLTESEVGSGDVEAGAEADPTSEAPELPGAVVAGQGMTREEWLALRDSGLGGSEIAGILGISPWESPYTIWARKRHEIGPLDESEPMRWGTVLEQPIAQEWSDRYGIDSYQPPPITIYRSKACPIALSSPDRLAENNTAWLEIKNVGRFKLDDWDEGIPDYYWAQAQWQLAVSGLALCHVVALVGGQDLRWRRVNADPKWQADAFEQAEAFWQRVQSGQAPEVDASEATRKALSTRYLAKTTEAIEGGDELAAAVIDYLEAQEAEKAAKTAKTRAHNAIQSMLREHEVGTIDGEPVVKITTIHRGGFDVAPSEYARLTILKGAR